MHLRERADVRTLIWAFGLMPAAAAAQFACPRLVWWFLPFSMYLGYCAAVISHNHNHSPTFTGRCTNAFLSQWLSFFYGYPIFAWIPTHNMNHHRFLNRPGDATITSLSGCGNTLFGAMTFPFASFKAQGPLISAFLRRVRSKSPRAHGLFLLQYAVVIGGHAVACAVAIGLYGPGRGTAVYASALGLPSLFALWAIMFTNYVQHVGCEPWSEYDHSRNFVSPWMNALLFDNGFHTVHHERAGLHWSKLRTAHAAIAHLVDPRLNESSILGYCFRVYVLDRLQGVDKAAARPDASVGLLTIRRVLLRRPP